VEFSPGGVLSGWSLVRVEFCPGGVFRVEFCPGGVLSGWSFVRDPTSIAVCANERWATRRFTDASCLLVFNVSSANIL